MPKLKSPEKDRLKKARLKIKARLKAPEGTRALPKMKLIRPTSPEEAKEFLRDVADHLSNVPYASRRFRFVAYAIKKYLRNGKAQDLHKELGLTLPHRTSRKKGHQSHPLEKIRAIAKQLIQGKPIHTIVKSGAGSQTTVERVNTELRAVLHTVPDSWRSPDGDVRKGEWRKIERRARAIDPPEWRKPIIQGICDTISAEDLFDPVDPANPHAPLPIDPANAPDLVPTRLK